MNGVTDNPYFVVVANAVPEAAASTLRTMNALYLQKKLESSPANWVTITELIDDHRAKGVIVKLNSRTFEQACEAGYRSIADELFKAIGSKPHVVFVHEEVMTGGTGVDQPEVEENAWDDYYPFSPPPEEIRLDVLARLEAAGIKVVPYNTNAELSILALAFVQDSERKLLFRIYVPVGRIYAAEADRLLTLFKEWLTKVKKLRVRQDGYSTGSGEVYELFGEGDMTSTDLVSQFSDFSYFLELCVSDPNAASGSLESMGVDPRVADEIVKRYGKESKRLHLDLQQSRESKLLSIRHRLQSELVDAVDVGSPEWELIDQTVDSLVPTPGNLLSPRGGVLGPGSATAVVVNQTVNQQIIGTVQGTVMQSVQGTVNLGPQAQELLALVQQFDGDDAAALESAVHELEDDDARTSDRVGAKQRLKAFLWKLEGKVEDAGLKVLQTYIEGKI